MALVLVGAWSDVSAALPAPFTDYANYPPPFPATCTVDGPSVLTGLQFSANGATSDDLRNLNITGGTTVTMTWTGFAPGCENLGIGLSFKIAKAPTFVITDNQFLQSFDFCGPEGPACAPPFSLSLTLPPAATVPCGQLDAHIGPPLAIVGPSGAYYNLNNPQNMLISAFNGGGGDCSVPPCATNPDVPAASMLCEAQPPTTTTTAPPTTTTAPPTTSTSAPAVCATNANLPADSPDCAPSTESTSGQICPTNPAVMADSAACQPTTASSAATCPAGQQMDTATGTCVATEVLAARVAAGQLPFTGSHTRPQLMIAGIMLLAGASLTLAFRRRPGSSTAS